MTTETEGHVACVIALAGEIGKREAAEARLVALTAASRAAIVQLTHNNALAAMQILDRALDAAGGV